MAQARIRWGILGVGAPNALVVAKAIEASATGALVAIAGSRESATKFADSFDESNAKVADEGISYYSKYEDLLADNSVDAVYIMLPNFHHEEWIINAIRAKKHVLCDPPFETSSEKMLKIINAVKTEKNIFCMEAMLYRTHSFYEDLKKIIVTDKILGDIRFYNAIYTTGSTPHDFQRGGSILNVGYYPLSLIRHLVNAEPISIEGTGTMYPRSREDSEATLILYFPNNVKATIQTANNVVMSWQFHVIGTKGTLSVISNPWFPVKHSIIHVTLYDPLNPNISLPVNQTMRTYNDTPLHSYAVDVLGQCVRIEALTANAVTLDHTLGNIKIVEEWRKKVAEKQAELEKSHPQPSLAKVGNFKPKANDEKSSQLYVPPRNNTSRR